MRIISTIHDYYDAAFRFSVGDKKDVFVRETSEITLAKLNFPETIQGYYSGHRFEYEISFGFLGFCGKIYPYIHLRRHVPFSSENPEVIAEYFYAYNKFAEAFPEIVKGKTFLNRHSRGEKIASIKAWLEQGTRLSWGGKVVWDAKRDHAFLGMFLDKRVAYFHASDHDQPTDGLYTITLYPVLGNYQFYKLFDVYAAYQEIEGFLTNQIVKPDDPYIAPVPDKVKVESHGFDKFSFRKDPSSKKRKVKK